MTDHHSSESKEPVTFAVGYRPGALGRIAELHSTYYAEHWGFGLFFEAKVATELAAFLQRYDAAHDRLWTAVRRGRIIGSVAIDGSKAGAEGAHLRWFILAEECRGYGVGRRLLDEAIAFCRICGFGRIFLWTFAGLDAARHLYEAAGFRLEHEVSADQWGKTMREQCFALVL